MRKALFSIPPRGRTEALEVESKHLPRVFDRVAKDVTKNLNPSGFRICVSKPQKSTGVFRERQGTRKTCNTQDINWKNCQKEKAGYVPLWVDAGVSFPGRTKKRITGLSSVHFNVH